MKYRPFVWIYWQFFSSLSFLLFRHVLLSFIRNKFHIPIWYIIIWHSNANEGLWMALEAVLMDRHQNKYTRGLLKCHRLPFILLAFLRHNHFSFLRIQNSKIDISGAKEKGLFVFGFCFFLLRLQYSKSRWMNFVFENPLFSVSGSIKYPSLNRTRVLFGFR